MGKITRRIEMGRARGHWSHEEDTILKSMIRKHGPRNWAIISTAIPGRSEKSCRLRWCNQLSPKVNHQPFTVQEDDTIIQAHARIGNKWSDMARMLPGRTDHAIKNRWNSILKQRCSSKYTNSTDDLGLEMPQQPFKRSTSLGNPSSLSGSDLGKFGLLAFGSKQVRPFNLSTNGFSPPESVDPLTSLTLSLPGSSSSSSLIRNLTSNEVPSFVFGPGSTPMINPMVPPFSPGQNIEVVAPPPPAPPSLMLSLGHNTTMVAPPPPFQLFNSFSPAMIQAAAPPSPPPLQPKSLAYHFSTPALFGEGQVPSQEFLGVVQEMIRKEVRSYFSGVERSGAISLAKNDPAKGFGKTY